MPKKSTDSESYQEMRQQLDDLMLKLQDPECDVDSAVAYYEQALQIVNRMEAYLVQAENRIVKIKASFGIDANTEA